jgi:magnesium-transporting ATPase (P-type)
VRLVAFIAVGVGTVFFGIALLLGIEAQQGFLLAIGVTVALVPEGLLPTVTLSLANGARRMSERHALVRSLEAVETLGSTTYLCTDKTGTLTCNEMSVVAAWLPETGSLALTASGYDPAESSGCGLPPPEQAAVAAVALSAAQCSSGRTVFREGSWRPLGDPMEAALHVLALRCGVPEQAVEAPVQRRLAFDPKRRRMTSIVGDRVIVKGAADAVLQRCSVPSPEAAEQAGRFSEAGLRVLAIAQRPAREVDLTAEADMVEQHLGLLGIVGLEDPPRPGAAHAVSALCRAGICVAMVTGDHPLTARAIADQVGLRTADSLVFEAADLPTADAELGALIDTDGIVVARATPQDKVRIATALQQRGHVVAMTGDGVNDGPALAQADIGVALGRSGTDVARETADLVLLDDHLATVVVAVETGRATFANIRKFLTYHLTDNVAELAPFVVWALSGGSFPLALTVLQVLALDIGTDLLPAIALGVEPASRRTLAGPMPTDRLIDRRMLARVFGVLGPVEAAVELAAFAAVLTAGGWAWGGSPSGPLLAAASGTAFAAVVLGQLANTFACRSATRWFGALGLRGNRMLLIAVVVELALLMVFLGVPLFSNALGGSWPTALGWVLALAAVPALLAVDTAHKMLLARRRAAAR